LRWINIPGLAEAAQSGSFYPGHGWWWWKASRVLADVDLQNQPVVFQPIDEFPGFSFLLGDNHPHKMALPFVLLAVGLALNLLLKTASPIQAPDSPFEEPRGWRKWAGWLSHHRHEAWLYLFYAVALGGIAFLNTWDFPIYLGLVLLAYACGTGLRVRQLNASLLWKTLTLGAGLGAASIILYTLFYASFSSQAGGILPYIFPPTRLPQYLVMFGPSVFVLVFFVPLAARLLARREEDPGTGALWGQAVRAWLWITGLAYGFYLLVLLLGLLVLRSAGSDTLTYLAPYLGGRTTGELLAAILLPRLKNPWVYLLLSGLLALALTAVLRAIQHRPAPDSARASASTTDPVPAVSASAAPASAAPAADAPASAASAPVAFALLLAFTGIALTLVVEFFYLRDVFGMRMNTIFKFYFQAWVLMGLAAAFGAVLVAAGLVYPVMGVTSRVEGFARPPDLDAAATVAGIYFTPWASIPDDWAAIQWLKGHVDVKEDGLPILLEGVNGSYQASGRVSAFTGFPALLGWPGHEDQWRGNHIEQGKREAVIARIYTTGDAPEALDLLRQWQVRYVIFGDPERQYIEKICSRLETPCNIRRAEEKFTEILQPLFTQGSITVYEVP
jgi:uncharacterized membrane protein